MLNLIQILKGFVGDARGSVQPEVIALTVSAMLLGVTYLESQRAADENPAVREEVYQRKCVADQTAAKGDVPDRAKFFCKAQ